MADTLKERISLLQMGAAKGKLRPEHQAELNRYVSQGLVKGAPSPQGVDTDDIQERISMRQAGMPVVEPTRNTFLHIKNPKVREETNCRMMANSAIILDTCQPEVYKARNALAAPSEFEDPNHAVRPTGGVVNQVRNWFKDALVDDELSRTEQLALGMVRGRRQPGERAVSDFEGK